MSFPGARMRIWNAVAFTTTALLPHGAAAELILGPSQVITSLAFGAESVVSADLDGDGIADLASANALSYSIEFFLNDGSAPPGFSPELASSLPQSPTWVVAADMDGDLDVDLASGSRFDGMVAWYENQGGDPPLFVDHGLLPMGFAGIYSVEVADIDGDGDRDVAFAARGVHTLGWFESDGATPPAFQVHVVNDTALHVSSVDIGDLDGDGDFDLVAGEVLASRVAWYENQGGTPPTFVEHVVADPEIAARVVEAVDVDRDGDLDVISGAQGGRVSWHENDGAAPPGFTTHLLSDAEGFVTDLLAADLDCDDDLDLFAASFGGGHVTGFENDGADPPGFAREILVTGDGATSMIGSDVDGDGAPDLVATWLGSHEVTWHRNLGATPACSAACRDGFDNDGDGLIDHPFDPGCHSPADPKEQPRKSRCGLGGAAPALCGLLFGLRRRSRARGPYG